MCMVSAMITSTAVHKYVFPVVRELADPDVGSEAPPDRRVVRPTQRDRVAASLLACPRSASGLGRRA
jgi:hypothetical protein